jgi:hypothetical protein
MRVPSLMIACEHDRQERDGEGVQHMHPEEERVKKSKSFEAFIRGIEVRKRWEYVFRIALFILGTWIRALGYSETDVISCPPSPEREDLRSARMYFYSSLDFQKNSL